MTTTPEALRALADRVERGESGREINGEVLLAVGAIHRDWDPGDGDISYWWEWSDGERIEKIALTTSLDATEALRERLLPGWTFTVRCEDASDGEGRWFECVMRNWTGRDRDEEPDLVRSFGFIPELNARLAALLRAYAAQIEETSDAG
jgi:hypothetical protein